MYKEYLFQSIKQKEAPEQIKKAVKDAAYQTLLYTGQGQDDILTEYRSKESTNQKNQRKRITITRTKHVVKQIENVLNQLDIMDKPAMSVITDNEKIKDELTAYIYNNNLSTFAFDMVKYHNIVDANAFLICRENQYGDIEFVPTKSNNLHSVYSVNGVLKAVVFKYERKEGNKVVYDFELYHNEGLIILTDPTNRDREGKTIEGGYIYEEIKTEGMFAFQLGYTKDVTTNLPLRLSILEAASELFKSLIWQGSELDVDVATHGIIQKFAYAKKCNHETRTDEGYVYCQGGYLYQDNAPTGSKCNVCNGSGVQAHTSSQDIITFPLPNSPENTMKLSDLTHIIFAPQGTFEFKKQMIKELQGEIIKTVFNSTILTQDEIAATATEKVIDLQGVYATLNQLSKHVSDCFIWMLECYCAIKGYKGVEFIHGYSLNLKLESVETLSMKRKTMLDAGAPMEIIRGIDLAILQKQHIDSPAYLNRIVIWEQYRPFSDKPEAVAQTILAGLPEDNYYKVLYNFWAVIKKAVEMKHGNDFYNYDNQKRLDVIAEEVEEIRKTLVIQTPERQVIEIDG